jgi:sugar phosphate isomerase/epimerase
MDNSVPLNRRTAIELGLAAGIAGLMNPQFSLASSGLRPKICIFAKPIQDLSYEAIADLLATFPVDGLEATVRAGGQVLPEKVDQQLPRLHEALVRKSREFMILATGIHSVSQAESEPILKSAAGLGIKYFRMGYYRYDLEKPILPQLDRFASEARQLAQMCGQWKMTALYQNHAGANYLGAPVLDLVHILNGISKEQMAIALDIRHTTIEGTNSWPLLYQAAKPHLGAVFVKDAIVEHGKVKDVDLGQGQAARELFRAMQRDGLPPALSLHTEQIDHADPRLQAARIAAIGRDVATLIQWLQPGS